MKCGSEIGTLVVSFQDWIIDIKCVSLFHAENAFSNVCSNTTGIRKGSRRRKRTWYPTHSDTSITKLPPPSSYHTAIIHHCLPFKRTLGMRPPLTSILGPPSQTNKPLNSYYFSWKKTIFWGVPTWSNILLFHRGSFKKKKRKGRKQHGLIEPSSSSSLCTSGRVVGGASSFTCLLLSFYLTTHPANYIVTFIGKQKQTKM